jgi:hypothetical protein
MHRLLPLLFLLAEPFWLQPAKQWSDAELDGIFKASPWTQTDGITVFFATAKPLRDAEYELRRRRGDASDEFGHDSDFDEFLKTRGAQSIVIAIRQADQTGLLVPEEMKRLERECRIRSGKKILKLEGLFPPTPGDPLLRLVFPRDLDPKAGKIRLELYIPALDGKAWRTFEFSLKTMQVNGKLEI